MWPARWASERWQPDQMFPAKPSTGGTLVLLYGFPHLVCFCHARPCCCLCGFPLYCQTSMLSGESLDRFASLLSDRLGVPLTMESRGLSVATPNEDVADIVASDPPSLEVSMEMMGMHHEDLTDNLPVHIMAIHPTLAGTPTVQMQDLSAAGGRGQAALFVPAADMTGQGAADDQPLDNDAPLFDYKARWRRGESGQQLQMRKNTLCARLV